jgi:hypothetical protein
MPIHPEDRLILPPREKQAIHNHMPYFRVLFVLTTVRFYKYNPVRPRE